MSTPSKKGGTPMKKTREMGGLSSIKPSDPPPSEDKVARRAGGAPAPLPPNQGKKTKLPASSVVAPAVAAPAATSSPSRQDDKISRRATGAPAPLPPSQGEKTKLPPAVAAPAIAVTPPSTPAVAAPVVAITPTSTPTVPAPAPAPATVTPTVTPIVSIAPPSTPTAATPAAPSPSRQEDEPSKISRRAAGAPAPLPPSEDDKSKLSRHVSAVISNPNPSEKTVPPSAEDHKGKDPHLATPTSSSTSASASASASSSPSDKEEKSDPESKKGPHHPTWRTRLQKYVLYETKTRYYFVGSDKNHSRFYVLKIDRTSPDELVLIDDNMAYSLPELRQLLSTLNSGNTVSGGLKKVCNAHGCLGFIRFTKGYYMVLVTKKKCQGNIGHHFVHSIATTELIYIPDGPAVTSPEEEKYRTLFNLMDLTNFYFSYTYDLSHSLQFNMTSPSLDSSSSSSSSSSLFSSSSSSTPSSSSTSSSSTSSSSSHSSSIPSAQAPSSLHPKNTKYGKQGSIASPVVRRGKKRPSKISNHQKKRQSMYSHSHRPHPSKRSPAAFVSEYENTGAKIRNLNVSSDNKLGDYSPMFVWNDFLFKDLAKATEPPVENAHEKHIVGSKWTLPLIHGFFQQCRVEIGGRTAVVSLIARRSRHFAGTRFLRRGVNDEGCVANDVETEQIVEDSSRTHLYDFGNFTSFVQVRGSIPLYWGQDGSIMAPKPPIFVSKMDPFYTSTFLHFQDMFARFGAPLVVLNLVKSAEKKRREGILRHELTEAMIQINASLPPEHRIIYIPWDFHKAFAKAKEEDVDVISIMNSIAEQAIRNTGIFHSGNQLAANKKRNHIYPIEGGIPYEEGKKGRFQSGVVRSNCIDSLDRTNAAQYVTGKVAYGWQLYTLGLTSSPLVDFEDEVLSLLVDMYQGMGNKLAVQYGGSNLAHTFSTYRNGNLVSKSRDLFTTITRFYSNTFSDKQKQDAIDLYLGTYVPSDPMKRSPANAEWAAESDQVLQMRKKTANDGGALLLNTKWWLKPIRSFTNRCKVSPHFPFAVDLDFDPKNVPPSFFANEYFKALHNPKTITSFDKRLTYRWEVSFVPMISRAFFFESSRTTPLPQTAIQEVTEDTEDPLEAFKERRGEGPARARQSVRGLRPRLEEEEEEEDEKESEGETVLSKGVKKWFNFHNSSRKQKGEERDEGIPKGPQLMHHSYKPSYDLICDVYARDEYGIRLEHGISKRNMELYSGYATSWSDLDNNTQAQDFLKGNIPQDTQDDYGLNIQKSKVLDLVSKDSLSTTYQEITNSSRSYIENARKLVSGKGNVSRESEVVYVKYCKEIIRLRGERGEKKGGTENIKLDELGPRPWNK